MGLPQHVLPRLCYKFKTGGCACVSVCLCLFQCVIGHRELRIREMMVNRQTLFEVQALTSTSVLLPLYLICRPMERLLDTPRL